MSLSIQMQNVTTLQQKQCFMSLAVEEFVTLSEVLCITPLQMMLLYRFHLDKVAQNSLLDSLIVVLITRSLVAGPKMCPFMKTSH